MDIIYVLPDIGQLVCVLEGITIAETFKRIFQKKKTKS